MANLYRYGIDGVVVLAVWFLWYWVLGRVSGGEMTERVMTEKEWELVSRMAEYFETHLPYIDLRLREACETERHMQKYGLEEEDV